MPFVNHTPEKEPCTSPEHEPPGGVLLEPGTHTWQCPACGEESTITVQGTRL